MTENQPSSAENDAGACTCGPAKPPFDWSCPSHGQEATDARTLAERARPPLRCRVFGHRWEQSLIDGVWRFFCRRCHRVEGYCGTRVFPPAKGEAL